MTGLYGCGVETPAADGVKACANNLTRWPRSINSSPCIHPGNASQAT